MLMSPWSVDSAAEMILVADWLDYVDLFAGFVGSVDSVELVAAAVGYFAGPAAMAAVEQPTFGRMEWY